MSDMIIYVLAAGIMTLSAVVVVIRRRQVSDFNMVSKEIATLSGRLDFYGELWVAAMSEATPEERDKLEKIHAKAVAKDEWTWVRVEGE